MILVGSLLKVKSSITTVTEAELTINNATQATKANRVKILNARVEADMVIPWDAIILSIEISASPR